MQVKKSHLMAYNSNRRRHCKVSVVFMDHSVLICNTLFLAEKH